MIGFLANVCQSLLPQAFEAYGKSKRGKTGALNLALCPVDAHPFPRQNNAASYRSQDRKLRLAQSLDRRNLFALSNLTKSICALQQSPNSLKNSVLKSVEVAT